MNTSNSGQAHIFGYLSNGQPVYQIDPTRLQQPAEPPTLADILEQFVDIAEELDGILNGYHAELAHLDGGCPHYVEGDESGRSIEQAREDLLREMVVGAEVLIQVKSIVTMATEVLG